ncbi:MAG: hypothetical protein M3066_06030 [Actinomycetota bacterium]|nr:hypothetical protein [Actinomycetota bacterium]
MTAPLDISVTVDAVPEVGLLRPAIEAALAGRAWPPGAEAAIGRAVADAVAADARRTASGVASC